MLNSSSGFELDVTPTPELEVLYPQPGAAVVVLHGEHDLSTKDHLHKTLTEALGAHRLVVVDVSVTEFVDSSVLGELIRADKQATDEAKKLRLQFGTAPIVRRAFEITGLLSALEWFPTRDEALEASPSPAPDLPDAA